MSLASFSVQIFIISIFPIIVSSQYWKFPKPCQSPDDCRPDECCAIGFVRFSVPVCKPLGGHGDWCYEENEPMNQTLYYPNGASETYNDIYLNFCPCSSHYSCTANTCSIPVSTENFEATNDAEPVSEIF
ncbi:astakine-like [Brevipalpus obovatus]|uniref:astakine-like n=1 Tax=Brevipalpus obovatus TaxID=246614 RepID=UPI003D9DB22A